MFLSTQLCQSLLIFCEQIGNVISQAQTTRAAWGSQRILFGSIKGNVKTLGDLLTDQIFGLVFNEILSAENIYKRPTTFSRTLKNHSNVLSFKCPLFSLL